MESSFPPNDPASIRDKLISNPTYEQQFKTIEELMQNAEMVINAEMPARKEN